MTVSQLRAQLEALERGGHGEKRVMIDVAMEYFVPVETIGIGADLQDAPERECAVINDTGYGLSAVDGERHYGI